MRRGLAGIFLMLLFLTGSAAGVQGEPVVKQVIFITLSKACGCLLEKCRAGEAVVQQVFVGPRQALLKRLDYVTQRDEAQGYIRQYRITIPPAILFLDSQGQELWRAMGELEAEPILNKLQEFGG